MCKPILKAITLHRPWGYAIAYLGKDIENRSWNCTLRSGSYLAIHNGKKWDQDAADEIAAMNPSELIENPTPENDPAGVIIAIARFRNNTNLSSSPWFCGPIGWDLNDVIAIDPVPAKGQQGLWTPNDETMELLRQNYGKAKNANKFL